MEVILILFTLFVVVNGLQKSGLMENLSRRIEGGKYIPLQLVVTTFFLSMLITNDVVLVVIVPLTLALNIDRKDILVILLALAANAGSALTPFGNPQNLFIYWFYDLSAVQFISAIAPFSFASLLLLVIVSLAIKTRAGLSRPAQVARVEKSAFVYGMLLLVVFLTVLRILPVYAALLVVLYVLVFDRRVLRVDYALLLSFIFFFGLAENIRFMLEAEISHSGHIFLFSALASQVLSNVPVAVLLAKFTAHWEALLWGVSVGGFGSLFGSLANLIAYRLYVNHSATNDPAVFTAKFLIIGYAAFFMAAGLYFVLQEMPFLSL